MEFGIGAFGQSGAADERPDGNQRDEQNDEVAGIDSLREIRCQRVVMVLL